LVRSSKYGGRVVNEQLPTRKTQSVEVTQWPGMSQGEEKRRNAEMGGASGVPRVEAQRNPYIIGKDNIGIALVG